MSFNLPRASVLLSLLAICVVAEAQVREPQIAGRVVRADNGLPIQGAAIELRPAWAVSSNGQFQTAITDSSGEYRFVGSVNDTTYEIEASADGFVSHTYSRDGTLDGVFQRVDGSIRLRGIDFQLRREAVIRGVLTDAEGKPAGPGISVSAVRKEKRENRSDQLHAVTWVKTDASGRYVLSKLESGTYFVCVNGPNGLNAFPDAGGWYRETWYGNGGSAEDATPLTLKEGEERNDARITVERERRYAVTIWPSGPEGQPKPERYSVHIEGRSHTSRQKADGSYVIPGIPPGHYRLSSVAWSGAEYQGKGDLRFDVTDADVTLNLQLGGLGEIQGIVRTEDQSGKLPSELMIGIGWHGGVAQGSKVDTVGHFIFERVLPGEYEFELVKSPASTVLRSVRCGGAEVTANTPLRVGDRQKVTNCEALVGPDSR